MLPAPQPERPHEWVARQLRSAILDGTHMPGDKLPVERELSERFQVSRSAVRQALLILDQQGLVRVKPGVGGGPFVALEPLPAAVAAFENLLVLDSSAADDFFEAKMVIEPAIALHAAQKLTPADFKLLEENIRLTREADDLGDDFTDLSLEFHSILFRCVGNRFIDMVLEIFARSFARLPEGTLEPANLDCVIDDHQKIYEALRGGPSPQVSELMANHIARIWNRPLPRRSTTRRRTRK